MVPGFLQLLFFQLLLHLSQALRVVDQHRWHPKNLNCTTPPNRIVAENCKEGTPPQEWEINAAGDPTIQGFSTQQSYTPGEKVVLKVKTDSADYRIDIYRVGWYGGRGARKVAANVQVVALPQIQPECEVEESTLLVDCGNWAPSAHWHVPVDSVSGVYFARLTRNDGKRYWRADASPVQPNPKFANPDWDYSTPPPCGWDFNCSAMRHAYGAQRRSKGPGHLLKTEVLEPQASHVYFVVRDDRPDGTDILFQTSDTTWHAYNTYGAPSTYGVLPLPHHGFDIPSAWVGRRAYKRSYNTPMLTRDVRSVNMLWGCEYPMIRWLERNGYDVAYWSGVDTDMRGAEGLQKHRVFLSVGHDEYWSGRQRANVEAARDSGKTHLAFFSGNEAYWRVRWEPDAAGNPHRTMVIYKDSQSSKKLDPLPDSWTGTFRDASPTNPQGPQPENSLTGTMWTVNAWRNDPLEVPHAYSHLRFWRHTEVRTLKPWQKAVLLRGLLGHEWDEDIDNGHRPRGLIRMSETTVHNVQMIFDGGATFDSGTATHHLVMYRAASGALVFGAGTLQWMWGLDEVHDTPTGQPNQVENEYNTRIGTDSLAPEPAVQQATVNLFKDMGILPASPEPHYVIDPTEVPDTVPPRCEIAVSEQQEPEPGTSVIIITGTAEDDVGVVAAVEYSADGGATWHPVESSLGARHVSWTHHVGSPLSSAPTSFECRATDDSVNTGPPSPPASLLTALRPVDVTESDSGEL